MTELPQQAGGKILVDAVNYPRLSRALFRRKFGSFATVGLVRSVAHKG